MMQTMKRGVALLVMLVMCISFVPALQIHADAAEVEYRYSGSYVYNWGKRGEAATFLSPMAKAFYTGNNTYDSLSAYAGGTGTSNAPSSALYKALQKLMVDNHSYETSYNATRDLYKYTDCEENGNKISSFYSGAQIGPDWDSGSTWNREHTWPNSKGLGGNDENDIMMLRPTASSENFSRSNKAYGQSSGYYHPNSESDGTYDVRGDVARIFLYVYVRWGNVSGNGEHSAWGSDGVIESLDVLLTWMEVDPVDTWELGRNDSVESITGTRNVFVDYPEFAFLLFGEEIPADMSSPSGVMSQACNHNNFDSGVAFSATCTERGYTLYTCMTEGCAYSYRASFTDAKGHSYVSGICSVCGEGEPAKPTYVTELSVGTAYKLGLYSTNKGAEYYFNGKMSTYYGATDTNYSNGVDMYVENASGGYYLYFKDSSNQKQYINLVYTGTHYNFTYSTTPTSVFTWDATLNTLTTMVENEVCYIGTYGTYVTMGVLRSSKQAATDYIARMYTYAGGEGETPGGCAHNYVSVVTAPTCVKAGYTTYTCSLCAHSYKDNEIAASGHTYENEVCTVCGAKKPAESQIFIDFSDASNRTVFNENQQVWVQNGVTVTNNKAASSSNVADYKNPARFYKNSELIIAYPGMTRLEIHCVDLDPKYLSGWQNVENATVTESGGIITIVFDSPVDSLVYSALSAQVRAYNIAVFVAEPETECEHEQTKLEGALDATCSAEGHTGKTVCDACGEILDAGEVIPKEDHAFGEWTQTVAPSIGASGEERRDCLNCDHYETREVAMGLYLSQFIEAVQNLSENASAEVKYGELCEALALYRKLTEEEKAAASEAYEILENAVEAYNTAAETANGELEEATRVAFLPIGTTFVFLGALLFLLRRKLML